MIAIVIYGIIAIALASVAGYSIISFFDASRAMSRASENLSRMDMVVSLIKANIRYVDGQPLVPMGSAGTDHSIVPIWMGAHDVSTYGGKYIYCPFASMDRTLGTTASVEDGDGNTYSVNTITNGQTGSNAYVYGFSDDSFFTKDTSLRDTGILAFLLSPLDGNSTNPICDDVELVDGNYVVDNGVVKVIQAGTISSQRNVLSSSKTVFYVDDVAAGDETGRDINNPSTLDEALSFMAVSTPRIMEIHMAAGSYSPTVTDFSSISKATGESKLLLIGDNGGNSTNVNITASNFSVPINLHLKDVNLDGDIIVEAGRKLFIEDSGATSNTRVESITLNGGELYIENDNTDLIITGRNADNAGISLSMGAKLVSVAESSTPNSISFTGSVTEGIFSNGDINLVNTDLTFSNSASYGISLSDGAKLNMNDSTIGGSGVNPTIGVYDDGGAVSVSGNAGTHVYAGTCWGGSTDNLFEWSGSSSSTPVGQTIADWSNLSDGVMNPYVESQAVQYNNRSRWSCN